MSVDNFMDNLPPEIIEMVMLNLDEFSLMQFCRTSKKYAHICKDDLFWKDKVRQDLGITSKPDNITWKQVYQRIIPVYINYDLYELIPDPEYDGAYTNWEDDILSGNQKRLSSKMQQELIDSLKSHLDMEILDIGNITKGSDVILELIIRMPESKTLEEKEEKLQDIYKEIYELGDVEDYVFSKSQNNELAYDRRLIYRVDDFEDINEPIASQYENIMFPRESLLYTPASPMFENDDEYTANLLARIGL